MAYFKDLLGVMEWLIILIKFEVLFTCQNKQEINYRPEINSLQ